MAAWGLWRTQGGNEPGTLPRGCWCSLQAHLPPLRDRLCRVVHRRHPVLRGSRLLRAGWLLPEVRSGTAAGARCRLASDQAAQPPPPHHHHPHPAAHRSLLAGASALAPIAHGTPTAAIGRFAWTTCAPCERCCDLGACRVRVGGCVCACKGVRECAAPLTITLLCTHLRFLPLPRGNTFADPLSLGTASCASASGDTTPYFNGVLETLCSPEGSGPNVVSLWQLQAGRQHQRTCCLCAPAHARPRCTLIPDISLDCAF